MSVTDPVVLVLGALALLGVLVAFRGGARAGARVSRQTHMVSRMGGVLGRAVGCGAVIVAVQWAVIITTTDPVAWAVVLGLPALFAGAALARVFVVTTLIHHDPEHHGHRTRR